MDTRSLFRGHTNLYSSGRIILSDEECAKTAFYAESLAKAGKRVLLMDMGVGGANLHQHFGLRNRVGVSHLVAREVGHPAAIQRTRVPGLHLITAGRGYPRQTDSLTVRLEAIGVAGFAGRDFDHIVVQLAPTALQLSA